MCQYECPLSVFLLTRFCWPFPTDAAVSETKTWEPTCKRTWRINICCSLRHSDGIQDMKLSQGTVARRRGKEGGGGLWQQMLTNSKKDTPGNMRQAGIACQRGDAWVTLYTFNYRRAHRAVKTSCRSIKTELGWIKRQASEKKESCCCFCLVCVNAGSVVLYLKIAHRGSGCKNNRFNL